MNTNDLRYIKTERILEEAYCSLKKKRVSFTLTQLCKEAYINKTTFYKHYDSLEVFETHVQRSFIRKIQHQCKYIDCAFTDTKSFVDDLTKAMQNNTETIQWLFYQNQDKLLNLHEELLLERYLKQSNSLEQNLKIRFAIGGASRILISNTDPYIYDFVINMITKAIS